MLLETLISSLRRNKLFLNIRFLAIHMFIEADIPTKYWAAGINTANFIQNRLLIKHIADEIPCERWNKDIPDLDFYKKFECKAIVHVPNQKRKKPGNKTLIFCSWYIARKAKNVVSWILRQTIVISRDAGC